MKYPILNDLLPSDYTVIKILVLIFMLSNIPKTLLNFLHVDKLRISLEQY